MRVQSLKLADYRPVFKQNENKNQDMDRPVTLQDLHDMEERLTHHMDMNYRNQNKMLGKTLYDIVDCIRYKDSGKDSYYRGAYNSANNLSKSRLQVN